MYVKITNFCRRYRSQLIFVFATLGASFLLSLAVELIFFQLILSNNFYLVRLFAMTLLLAGLVFLIRFRTYFYTHLAKAYLLIAVTCGSVFLLVLPRTVYISYDDQIHFLNAYSFFSADFEWTDGLRAVESQTFSDLGHKSLPEVIELYRTLDALDREGEASTIHMDTDPEPYLRLIYLPYFVGIQIGRFLQCNLSTILLVAKFCNYAVMVALLYFAVKLCGQAQRIFFAVALLLSSMFFGAQFSYDPLIFACLVLAFAIFLYMLKMPRVSPKYAFSFVLLVVLASLPKAIYSPMLLLTLLLPKSKFRSPRQATIYKTCAIALSCLLMATFVLPTLVGSMAGDIRGGNVSVSGQVAYVVSHPLAFLRTLCSYLVTVLPQSIFGQEALTNISDYFVFSHMSHVMQLFFISQFLYLCYMIFSTHLERKVVPLRLKVIFLAFYALIVLLIIGALYAAFNPVGATSIGGVQARYFLPILPMLLICLAPTRARHLPDTPSKLEQFTIIAVPYLILATFICIFIFEVSRL